MTPTEKKMWGLLRNRRFCGIKFCRQVPIDRYIVDFCCRQRRFILEIDGGVHSDEMDYDRERDLYFAELKYQVLHVSDEEVENDIESTLQKMKQMLGII